MASLDEVYSRAGGKRQKRFNTGIALFATGGLLVISGILFSTTDILSSLDLGYFTLRKFSGILAGIGMPLFLFGVFTVLPATAYQRASAIIGSSISLFGVLLFWYAYPYRWIGATHDHITLFVVIVYFAGFAVTLWSLFIAMVNFKIRNDPGGTVILQRIINGETQFVEVPKSAMRVVTGGVPETNSVGTIGILGNLPQTSNPTNMSGEDAEIDRL